MFAKRPMGERTYDFESTAIFFRYSGVIWAKFSSPLFPSAPVSKYTPITSAQALAVRMHIKLSALFRMGLGAFGPLVVMSWQCNSVHLPYPSNGSGSL